MKPESDELDATLDASELGVVEMASPSPGPSVGDVLAQRYHLEEEVGRGGMGAVFRAHDAALGETVALKLLTEASERSLPRFRDEVRLARRVTHPNIARIHDLGESDGAHFLTMEYVPGRTLEDLIAEGPLQSERTMSILRAILRGLEAAHAVGVIHRDLKPSNVLVADDGRIVLTDFGIAATLDESESRATIVGTPAYMAPEQVRGASCDARSDLYSLGVVLHEMLAGELPFEGDTAVALAFARLVDEPSPLRDGTPPLRALVTDLLAVDPGGRPASAAGVIERLTPRRTRPAHASGPFAPVVSAGVGTLAVLPFVYRGPDDLKGLGESLAEETIDVLSRTKGLRVLAFGATARFAEDRDPIHVARSLAADSVVDGSVQLVADRVRVKARLVDGDGVQRWSERFDADLTDVFELSESMARRVTEELRVQLSAWGEDRRAEVPRRAVEAYLTARRLMREAPLRAPPRAIALLEECLEVAPGFTQARAAHAVASVRRWWSGISLGAQGREAAEASVAAAVEHAPDLAETHFAAAMLQLEAGALDGCAKALARALEIAPTYAEAQHYLANLQLEADRLDEGRSRLQLAKDLYPTDLATVVMASRELALDGALEAATGMADEAAAHVGDDDQTVIVMRLRFALWQRDFEAARAQAARFGQLGGPSEMFARFIGYAWGDCEREEAEAMRALLPEVTTNRRYIAISQQIAAEVYAARGDYELALRALGDAAAGPLIDASWLRRCALFDPLRDDPAFQAVQAQVRARAAELWRG